MSIPVTQYMRPNGRAVPVSIDRPPEVEEQARAVTDRGWRFEAEVLTTGDVSLTVHDPEAGEDVAIEVVPNGPEVPPAMDRLVAAAYRRLPDTEGEGS